MVTTIISSTDPQAPKKLAILVILTEAEIAHIKSGKVVNVDCQRWGMPGLEFGVGYGKDEDSIKERFRKGGLLDGPNTTVVEYGKGGK